jgi:hypothetical protein
MCINRHTEESINNDIEFIKEIKTHLESNNIDAVNQMLADWEEELCNLSKRLDSLKG